MGLTGIKICVLSSQHKASERASERKRESIFPANFLSFSCCFPRNGGWLSGRGNVEDLNRLERSTERDIVWRGGIRRRRERVGLSPEFRFPPERRLQRLGSFSPSPGAFPASSSGFLEGFLERALRSSTWGELFSLCADQLFRNPRIGIVHESRQFRLWNVVISVNPVARR